MSIYGSYGELKNGDEKISENQEKGRPQSRSRNAIRLSSSF